MPATHVPRERMMRWPLVLGCFCALLALANQAVAAKGAGRAAARSAGSAVVTYVTGQVVVLKDGKPGGRVAVGDELPGGTRLRLENASRVSVLWANGGRSTISGPRKTITLSPAAPPKRAAKPARAASIIANLVKGLRALVASIGRGRSVPGETSEYLVMRGPADLWQARPDEERVRPGTVDLTWRCPADGGDYQVIVWDTDVTAPLWKARTREQQVTVPLSVGLRPGQVYHWMVWSTADGDASMHRFAVLDLSRATALEEDLRSVQELLAQAKPSAELHFALGCVYASYGLLTEARAEYDAAARASQECPDYQALSRALAQSVVADLDAAAGPEGARAGP